MTDFLSNILSFPTLFYTGLLVLTLLYWFSSMMGIVDFDFDGGEVGGHDGLDNIDSSLGWLNRFKLDGIPVSISLSFVIFSSWALCFLLVHYYQDKVEEGWLVAVIGIWVTILVPIISAMLVGILLSPLKPFFQKLKQEAEGRKADTLIGQVATVRTNKVNQIFGDAEVTVEGASLILKIRLEEPNELKRGDKVLITHYLEADNTYTVKKSS